VVNEFLRFLYCNLFAEVNVAGNANGSKKRALSSALLTMCCNSLIVVSESFHKHAQNPDFYALFSFKSIFSR